MSSFKMYPAPVLVVFVLCLSAAPPARAAGLAPWDGIVGFLQTVARLRSLHTEQDYHPEPPSQPLRKIVYAVEEQVTLGDSAPSPPQVVFDSAAQTNHTSEEFPSNSLREKRSPKNATTNGLEAHGEGRATATVNRPIFIGRKLWYAPLWFGLYLILYILVLTVKSVARHRIRYPTLVAAESKSGRRHGDYNTVNGITNGVEKAVESASRRYRYNYR